MRGRMLYMCMCMSPRVSVYTVMHFRCRVVLASLLFRSSSFTPFFRGPAQQYSYAYSSSFRLDVRLRQMRTPTHKAVRTMWLECPFVFCVASVHQVLSPQF